MNLLWETELAMADRYEVLVIEQNGIHARLTELEDDPAVGDAIEVDGARVRVVAVKEPLAWMTARGRLICRPVADSA